MTRKEVLSKADPHKKVSISLRTPKLYGLQIYVHAHTHTNTMADGSHGDCVAVRGIFQAVSGTADTPEFVLEVFFDLRKGQLLKHTHFLAVT